MLYIKFIDSYSRDEDLSSDKSSFFADAISVLAVCLFSLIIPKTNPTIGKNLNKVKKWYVELDDKLYVTREIGLDKNENVVFKAPYKNNLGFWVDEDTKLSDLEKFSRVEQITFKDFDSQWKREIVGETKIKIWPKIFFWTIIGVLVLIKCM